VNGVVVDFDDEPMVSGGVMGAAKGRSVTSGEDALDEEFDVEPAEDQH
jgi:hypothetical protein